MQSCNRGSGSSSASAVATTTMMPASMRNCRTMLPTLLPITFRMPPSFARILAQSRTKGCRHSRVNMLPAIGDGRRNDNPADPVGVSVEPVVAEFESNIPVDHHAGQDTKCEAKDIDGCRQLMPAQTAQGEKQLFYCLLRSRSHQVRFRYG